MLYWRDFVIGGCAIVAFRCVSRCFSCKVLQNWLLGGMGVKYDFFDQGRFMTRAEFVGSRSICLVSISGTDYMIISVYAPICMDFCCSLKVKCMNTITN